MSPERAQALPTRGRPRRAAALEPQRILVPLDGLRAAEAALPAAVERARVSGASLYLLYILAGPAAPRDPSPRHGAAVSRAQRYLAATRRRIAADGITVSTAVWSGSPAAAIVKAADLIDADLIAMARSGPTGAPPALVGSVVDRVLRGTKRPLLVLAPPEAPVDRSLGDAVPVPDGPAPGTARARPSLG